MIGETHGEQMAPALINRRKCANMQSQDNVPAASVKQTSTSENLNFIIIVAL